MRVLQIRLANLASLAGEHVVDLEGELSGVGILPITGKTGAGKSTILDAMTVALYRRVARLPAPKTRGVAEDETGLPANDPRTLLREDAGEGFAEVEFMSHDGLRYRARWEVRRARGKAGARLQKEKWSLVDVAANRSIGHKIGEVADAIEERVGLNYVEFCQTIVLPQGRFAKLLRSSAKERAELLESITGTGIYSRISQLAHEQAREAKRRMADVATQINIASALPDEKRTSLELRRSALAGANAMLHRRVESQREHSRHLKRLDELRERASAAALEVETARSQVAALAETEVGLKEATRLQSLRALFDAETDRTQRLAAAKTSASLRDADLKTSSAESAAADEAFQKALHAKRALDHELERLKPELRAARDLDRDLQTRTSELAAMTATRAEAQAQVKEARTQVVALESAYKIALDERRVAESWLAEHAGDERLDKSWGQTAPRLERLAQLETTRANLGATLAETKRKLAEGHEAKDALATEAKSATAESARLETALAKIVAELQELGEATLRAEEDELNRSFVSARDAADVADAALALSADRDAADTLAASHEGRLFGLRHRERETRESETDARAARELHRRLLDEARAIASYAEVRGELSEGEPCFLCGSLEHPYVAEAPDPVLSHLDAAAKTAQSAHESALTALTSVRARQQACIEALEEARDAHCGLDRRFEAKLAQLRTVTKLPGTPLAMIVATLQAQREQLVGKRAALSARGERIEKAREAQAELQENIDTARTRQQRTNAQLSNVQVSLASDEKSLTHLTDQQANTRKEADVLRAELGKTLPGFDETFDTLNGRAQLEARVLRYADKKNAFDDASKRAGELKHQTELKQAKLDAAVAGWRREADECAAVESTLSSLRERRASVLDGRSVDAVEAALEERHALVSTENQQAAAQRAQAEQAMASAKARQEDASSALTKSLAEHETATRELHTGLRSANVERAAAELVLGSWDEARVEAAKGQLEQVRSALAVAEGIRHHRLRELAEHAPAPFTPEELEQNIERSTTALQLVGGELQQATQQQAIDNERRATVAGLNVEHATARAEYESAEALSGLIGSADGALLRTFAQGLTLEVMVERANTHLQDLAPNLRLRRQGDVDLEVIDSDNADATRSVHSLSGGESFLVSLSLALALGSLSGEHVHVESMFIDEGFGSLDVDTLECALAALETLHAQGRQVVLISHVAGLVERFPVHVRVRELGPGRSTVETIGGPDVWAEAV